MAFEPSTFLGGLLLGFASSLHCAGMCGPIASSLMFAFSPGGRQRDRAGALAAAHAGRVLIYVAAGAAMGGLGSLVVLGFDHASAFAIVRWAGAVGLAWIGLSVAGFAPPLSFMDRIAAPIVSTLRFGPHAAFANGSGAFLSGVMWGFLPCGMVYGALFYAMLTGSALRGAAVMTGFGLGSLPSVTAVALGLSGFRRLAHAPNARFAVGLAIVAVAVGSLAVPAMTLDVFCLR
jgi:sulfite exporter TauE/SafE